MTKPKLLAAAAIVLTSALAGPVMAQPVITNPGKCAQFYPDANCQNYGAGNPYTDGGYRRHATYRHNSEWNNADNGWNNNGWNNHDTGFWPGDVAAGVVGGAVGTAGAIATAPFQSNSYAYYNNGYNNGFNGYTQSYAERNGFVCQPGTWFKGEDGRRHPCQ
jgi:glycosidase